MCGVSRVGRRAGLLSTGRQEDDTTRNPSGSPPGGDLLPQALARPAGLHRPARSQRRHSSSHAARPWGQGEAHPPTGRARICQALPRDALHRHVPGASGCPKGTRVHRGAGTAPGPGLAGPPHTGLTCPRSVRGSHVVSVKPTRGSRVCSTLSAWTRPHVCSAELSRHPGQALNISRGQDLPGPSRASCPRVSVGQLAWAPTLHAECWVWPTVLTAAPALLVGDGRRPASALMRPRSSPQVTQCPPLSRVRQGGDPRSAEQHPQSAPAHPPPWRRVTTAPQPRGKREPLPWVPVGQAGRPITP